MKGQRVVNPIIDWQDNDVLDYAAVEKISMNPLYCEGFHRVGCIGCPMAARTRAMEFARYPRIKAAYIRAFDKMLSIRLERGLETYSWQSGVDVFHWWMEDGVLPGQEVLGGFEE